MPYNIIDLIESDETMSTCQMFNAEVCFDSGLVYDAGLATAQVKAQVDDFMLETTSQGTFTACVRTSSTSAFASA